LRREAASHAPASGPARYVGWFSGRPGLSPWVRTRRRPTPRLGHLLSRLVSIAQLLSFRERLGRPESPVHPRPGRACGPTPEVTHEHPDAHGLSDGRPGALDSPQALGTGEGIATAAFTLQRYTHHYNASARRTADTIGEIFSLTSYPKLLLTRAAIVIKRTPTSVAGQSRRSRCHPRSATSRAVRDS
jgi:hypothetical protein